MAMEDVIREMKDINEVRQREEKRKEAAENIPAVEMDQFIRKIRSHPPLERLAIMEAINTAFCHICGRDHDEKYDRTCHGES